MMSLRVRGDIARVFAVCLGVALVAAPARAQDAAVAASTVSPLLAQLTPSTTMPDEHRAEVRAHASAGRGVLLPLYMSFASLQMLDAHSTLRAARAGAVEQNPLMQGLADKPAALVALKTAWLCRPSRLPTAYAAAAALAPLS
jgi:hypothetical protein